MKQADMTLAYLDECRILWGERERVSTCNIQITGKNCTADHIYCRLEHCAAMRVPLQLHTYQATSYLKEASGVHKRDAWLRVCQNAGNGVQILQTWLLLGGGAGRPVMSRASQSRE